MSQAETDWPMWVLLSVAAALVLFGAWVLMSGTGPLHLTGTVPECVVAYSPDGAPIYGDCAVLSH